MAVFDQNDGLTPLEKSQIFDFFKLLFSSAGKAVFLSRIFSNTFCWAILSILKIWKNYEVLTKTVD